MESSEFVERKGLDLLFMALKMEAGGHEPGRVRRGAENHP